MHRIGSALGAFLLACLLVSAIGQPAARAQTAPPPAPLAKLTAASFARLPFVQRPRLSPDGQWMAGLIGQNGRQIIAIFGLFNNQLPVSLGVPDGTQARWISWVNDDNIIIGLDALLPVETENWYVSRVIAVNRKTGKITKLLWDLNGQNASDVLWMPSDGSDEILMAGQKSVYIGNDFWPAIYRVNVVNGRSRQVVRGQQGVNSWYADDHGHVRAGIAYIEGTRSFRLLYRGAESTGTFRTIDRADTRLRQGLMRPFLFLPGTDHALTMHDDNKGRSSIYEVDLLTRNDVRPVFVPPDGRAEVDDVILSEDGTSLLGVTLTDAVGTIHWIDPALADLQAQFDKAVQGHRARILSFNRDRTKMLVHIADANMPGMLYYYDAGEGRLQRIANINQEIAGRSLAPVTLVHYKSRDGLDIEGVLTLPAGAAAGKRPFIVMPHGGPWAQDSLSYDYIAQFVASIGYAVLQPNFRGSTGYGTEFLRRGEGQMGLAMQDDITDGVRWAIDQGIADPARICIVGASYGGYAAMWGIAKDPDLYRCAVSISGVSSLRREVNDFSDSVMGGKYRDDWTRMTPDFNAVSPANAIDRIHAPLLLIHGKKDITVDASQSSRMFASMQKAGKAVNYVSLPLADHYFSREADRLTLLSSIETFLAAHNPVGANAAPAATASAR